MKILRFITPLLERLIQTLTAVLHVLQKGALDATPSLQPDATTERIIRQDVINLLKINSSYEIDLSNKKMNQIDLSGLDLRGIDFSGSQLRDADFTDSFLQDAKFVKTNCRRAIFIRADISRANLSYCYFREANLADASFYRAKADWAVFQDANLSQVNLYQTSLDNVKHLSPRNLKYCILQENMLDYVQYHRWFMRFDAQIERERVIHELPQNRLREAENIYRKLKITFANNGQYADSSWAYVRERQMRRQRHGLWQARHNFSQEYPENGRFKQIRRVGFYLKHLGLWLLDWLAELSCGYGERPLRPIFWAAATLAVFPAIYATVGGISGPQTWLDYFNYSLASFTTLGFDQFSADTPLAQTLTSLEAIIGISILALLMFVLGNRISRA